MQQSTQEFIASLLRPRDPLSNKGSHGHALLCCGSATYRGAARLASEGALRTGAGSQIPHSPLYWMLTGSICLVHSNPFILSVRPYLHPTLERWHGFAILQQRMYLQIRQAPCKILPYKAMPLYC